MLINLLLKVMQDHSAYCCKVFPAFLDNIAPLVHLIRLEIGTAQFTVDANTKQQSPINQNLVSVTLEVIVKLTIRMYVKNKFRIFCKFLGTGKEGDSRSFLLTVKERQISQGGMKRKFK